MKIAFAGNNMRGKSYYMRDANGRSIFVWLDVNSFFEMRLLRTEYNWMRITVGMLDAILSVGRIELEQSKQRMDE